MATTNGDDRAAASLASRQTTTRWTPTAEQIRILKDLYYNNGVRSPSADQIQRISAKLRQYGKIEGKNVFYWFQNHKARERQKKRFTAAGENLHHHRQGLQISDHLLAYAAKAAPPHRRHGSADFRDCSATPPPTFAWDAFPPPCGRSFHDQNRDEEEDAPEIETLSLFPMHSAGDDHHRLPWQRRLFSSSSSSDCSGAGGSLELTLNSYGNSPLHFHSGAS
ncbi:hypothetical protein M569_04286 [Genlisea aurea]|uniref:Protein WUSCHEL n=1 Tax=Genlisea aurea TaxID=192259 RepID=S8CT84_9LAMI|nr:hypothetical protein M569_04286 [Genlisea aurea]